MNESYEYPACCGIHYAQSPGGHCDWTCCEHRSASCEDCGDEFDPQEGCQHDGHSWCGSCFVERCPACAADLADDYAAELSTERGR